MIKKAYFAGGCFWGLEQLFRKLPGIIDTETGYTGGTNPPAGGPTYENHTGHAEALEITYNTDVIDFWHLLDFFFQIHNPTTLNQQGNDIGTSYRSAIFYQDETEYKQAEDFIKIVNDSERWKIRDTVMPVVTTLEPFTKFWPAEDYHQDYLEKNPNGYTCHAIWFESYLK